jgi:hypothetical protein
MEKYTVRSFFKDRIEELVDERYFNSIRECQDWCCYEYKSEFEQMYFEIHHSVGALTYYKAIMDYNTSIHWKEIEYKQQDIPLIRPWWKITELPKKLR